MPGLKYTTDRLSHRQTVAVCLVILLSLIWSPAGASGNTRCKTPECKYYSAENTYNKLLKNPNLKKRRDKWVECIKMFKDVYETDPKGLWAPAGLYMTGKLYSNLYKYSHNNKDLENAVSYLSLAKQFQKSRYSLEAVKTLRTLPAATPKKPSEPKHIVTKTPSKKKQPKQTIPVSVKGKATVKGLRHGSLPTRTRIVIDTDKPVAYKHGVLKRNSSKNLSRRIYVDITNSTLNPSINSDVTINDKQVKGYRAAYNDPETVRVVIDANQYRDYKIFSLRKPSRVVIDVWGTTSSVAVEDDIDDDDNAPSINSIIGTDTLAKQLQLGVRRIVIDPGHGGHDRGAPGYLRGVKEKDVVLSISKKLAAKIRKELNCEVILTRSKDTFITLEERTRLANRKKADLFISIHTNASRDKRAYGIETYFLNLAKDRASVSVAARENATSEKNISDLQTILNSLMRNTKINESSRLAKHVQDELYGTMKRKYRYIKNKGVKQAPFYVLLGARMPAILVETSFISNKRECKRLTDSEYQNRLCDAIIDGIKKYIKETCPSSMVESSGQLLPQS